MRLRFYHFALPIAALCTVWAVQDEQPRYQDRGAAEQAQERGIRGAFEYLSMLRSNVNTGQVEPNDIIGTWKAAEAAAAAQPKALGLQWIEMGPDNVGGRTRTICIDPTNSNVLYAGGVSGGLWKSTDAANTWTQVTGLSESLIVSTVAVLGNGHIFVGTGSTFDFAGGSGGSGFLGHGLFRSVDGGATFENLFGPAVNWSGPSDWTEVDKIVADPNNADGCWVGYDKGLKYYDESDGTLTSVGGVPANQKCVAIEISTDGQTLVAVMVSGTGYISTDAGQNFTLCSAGGTGFPTSVGRLEFTISPDDSNFIYALAATNGGSMQGVWATNNKGGSWTRVWPSAVSAPALNIFGSNNQGGYDNVISAVPGSPDEFWAGGVSLWKSSFNGTPSQIAVTAAFPGCFNCVHADVHEITWDPNNPLIAYVGTDGGVFKSNDGGMTFFAHNRGYNVTQFYGIGYGPQNQVIGGTQDNSTPFNDLQGNTLQEAEVLFGGDGFDCDISQIDPNIMFGTSQNGVFARTSDAGNSGSGFSNTRMDSLQDANGDIGDFYTNIRLYENYDDLDSPDSTLAIHTFTVTTEETVNDLIGQSVTFDYSSGKVPAVDNLSEVKSITPDMLPSGVMLSDSVEVGDEFLLTTTLPDRVESLFAIGFGSSDGVWVTREALSFNGPVTWMKVLDQAPSVNCMEWSADGNCLFIGGSNGQVARVCGFDQVHTFEAGDVTQIPEFPDTIINTATNDTIISNFTSEDYANNDYVYPDGTPLLFKLTNDIIFTVGAPVTGLGPDPNNNDRLLITLGGYGGSQKVRISNDALAASPTFTNVWSPPSSDLNGMPVYDGIIHASDPNIFVVGTEYGVMATDDGGSTWSFENNGMQMVPVFAVRQQTWDANNSPFGATYIENPYTIFLGTHGRGWYRSESLLGIDPNVSVTEVSGPALSIYPNPMNGTGTLSMELSERAMVEVTIFDISGKQVAQVHKGNMGTGAQLIDLDTQGLSSGTYILNVLVNGTPTADRFVVQ